MEMKLNKKQLRLLELVEKCGYLFRNEVNKQEYPDSMIDALINKGLLAECKNKLTSTTAV
jgi:hypothetical protein